jgi:small subunit ribosomal protein S2
MFKTKDTTAAAKTAKSGAKDQIGEMFEAGAHFGFAKSRRHPSVKSFIFGRKNNVEIFDLEKVEEQLEKAKSFVTKIAESKRQILFVGGKRESQKAIKEGADKIDMPYVAGRWIGGTLTNFEEVRKRVTRLNDLSSQRDKGELGKYTKKEKLLIEREIEKLDETFGGIVPMDKKPAAIFIVDADKEENARNEAITIGIPIVSLCSSDCDITKVDYPITANDSSVRSIEYFVNEIVEAYQSGSKK